MEQELHPNAGKNDIIEVDGVRYQRLPIKTHLITDKDNILDVAEKYGKPVLGKPGDVLFIPKGSAIEFGTPSAVRFFYVTYPADWQA